MKPDVKTDADPNIVKQLLEKGYVPIPGLDLKKVSPEEGKGVDLMGSELHVGDILVMSVQSVGEQSILVAKIRAIENINGNNNKLELKVAIGDVERTITVSERASSLQLPGKVHMVLYVAAVMRRQELPGISA